MSYAVGARGTVLERFNAKWEISQDSSYEGTPCWIWNAYILPGGYGRFSSEGQTHYAHRISFTLFVGEIPEGLTIDHLCRMRNCVNPKHLDPVSLRENLMRGQTLMALNASKTHCPQGHPYSGDNLRLYRNMRVCIECALEHSRQQWLRKKKLSNVSNR